MNKEVLLAGLRSLRDEIVRDILGPVDNAINACVNDYDDRLDRLAIPMAVRAAGNAAIELGKELRQYANDQVKAKVQPAKSKLMPRMTAKVVDGTITITHEERERRHVNAAR